jgi:hypothetical protein
VHEPVSLTSFVAICGSRERVVRGEKRCCWGISEIQLSGN